MSEITNHLSGYLGEMNNYMERLNDNRLSRKDRQNFWEMSNEYYDIFKESIAGSKDNINAFPEELLEELETFIDNIIDPADDRNLANQYYDIITQRSNYYIGAVEHTELQIKIFQNDAEIFRLQNEKIQMMQRLADLEMQRDGQISPETMAILEVQNSEIVNGRVREIGEWEQEKVSDGKPEQQIEVEEQNEPEKEKIEPAERKRIIDKDELDQILNDHFRDMQSGNRSKTLDLSNCIISNYVFKGDLDSISFDKSELRYCEFRATKSDHISMQGATVSNCQFNQAEFGHSNFKNANIRDTVILGNMFREGSFDAATLKYVSIMDSVFYKTTFNETRIRECTGGENIFHECGNPENTIKAEHGKTMSKEKFTEYQDEMKELFSNDGYSYSWDLRNVDIKGQQAELAIKISRGGEMVEEEKYSAILDPDMNEIVYIDTGRHDDPLAIMFTPEINAAIEDHVKEQMAKAAPVVLKFPYMKKKTFMKVKDEIKKMGAKFNPVKKEWYVDQSVGQDMINKITDYLSAHDEAIYLRLPYVKPQKYKQIIEQIKQDGARYNPDKKQWYITESSNRIKFFEYLPASEISAITFNPQSQKDFVREKLEQYKAETVKKQPDNRIKEHQKKEVPERV